jgi:hypothetical protein
MNWSGAIPKYHRRPDRNEKVANRTHYRNHGLARKPSAATISSVGVGFRRRLQWRLSNFNALQMSSEYAAYQKISSVAGHFTKRPLRWQDF